MAKSTKKKDIEAAASDKITVAQLADKLGVEGRILRQFIRAQGFKAPEVKQEGFGPRAKYEWDANSADLKQILTAWEKAQASGE